MRKILTAVVAALAVASFQSAAYAKSAQDELKDGGCLSCHESDKKKVGPSFKDIGAKYKGKKAEDVIEGLKGKPVHKGSLAKSNDASLKVIAEYLLKQ